MSKANPGQKGIKKKARWDLYVIRDISGWGMFSNSYTSSSREEEEPLLLVHVGDMFSVLALETYLL